MEEIKRFDLQLFAEESDGDGPESPENPIIDKEPEGKEEPKPKYTDADVDKILDKKFAEWEKKKAKQISEAERLGKMTEAEKANERIKQLEKRLEESDRREAVAAMTKEARAILQDKNIHVSDALLANLIAEDAESTKSAVESFVSLFKSAVEKAVKDALKGEPPKTGGSSGMTKEQILAVANRAERQRLISENMHLFK